MSAGIQQFHSRRTLILKIDTMLRDTFLKNHAESFQGVQPGPACRDLIAEHKVMESGFHFPQPSSLAQLGPSLRGRG